MVIKIKEFRKKAGITQLELSEKVGVSVRTIQGYEANKITPPIDKLNKIAAALNIPVAELLNIDKIGDSTTYVNDEGSIYHVIPKKNIDNPELNSYDEITLITEYICRKADQKGHIISNWKKIIDDVDNIINGDIAQEIIKRGKKID
ncbi:helix-turn-helix domain-containing protein [Oceanirhabdus sp. W0125-5]|uniref:helix-turn-helix domain-containing protein n=1 Tax=Oceanirhabdus sp. W0125-5 TaxID=2999116 RepID=UPI0022F320EF|nr:helix-turn-helix transcriptional regulator [Oceanirhabdus sp. W0125-5]WBW97591.1 helix-turn-helix transcriptional regulator [Oceanirhabdus sp. W0125-5]